MNSYLLLFRGINVGGNNLLPMKELKALLKPEYGDVETYIQTGNVIVRSNSDPCEDIANKVNDKFGFKPQILSLSFEEFTQAINTNPYQAREGKTVHFFFCSEQPNPDVSKIDELVANCEEYCLVNNVFYLYAPNGIGRSKLAAKVEKLLGVVTTARNLNTVNKINSMFDKFT